MISSVFSRVTILAFGSLYPAYASFKAVRARNVKDYVKWMMYWIVFAIFLCIETITDIFLYWFPFYYEIKVLLIFWLLSPVTNGSSILYRNFVHPVLKRKESKIDNYIVNMKQQSYANLMQLARKGLHHFSAFITDSIHLNLGSVLYQTTPNTAVPSNQHGNKSDPDIIMTPVDKNELLVDEFNCNKDQNNLAGIDSEVNPIGETTRKTRKGGSVASESKPACIRDRRRRGKTIVVEKE